MKRRFASSIFILFTLLALTFSAAGSAPVQAKPLFAPGDFLLKWRDGIRDGQFSYPTSVAVDSAENVYVANRDNHRIQKFDSSGTFLLKWGSYGSGDGQFYLYCSAVVCFFDDFYRLEVKNWHLDHKPILEFHSETM